MYPLLLEVCASAGVLRILSGRKSLRLAVVCVCVLRDMVGEGLRLLLFPTLRAFLSPLWVPVEFPPLPATHRRSGVRLSSQQA